MPPAVWVVVVVAALIALGAGCRPVGHPLGDAVLVAGFAAAVVLLGAHAWWPPLLLGGAVVAAAGSSVPVRGLGLAVVVAVVVLERRGRIEPTAAALVSLVVVEVALRLPTDGRLGTSAALAALAVLPFAASGARRLPLLLRRPMARIGLGVAAFALVGLAVAGAAVVRAHRDLDAAQRDVTAGVEAARSGDVDAAAASFRSASIHFAAARGSTGAWWTAPADQVPVVAQHLAALDSVAALGGSGAELALDGTTEVDVDRLRLVDGSLDPEVVRSFQPVLARLSRQVEGLRDRAADLGSPWLVAPVQRELAQLDRTAAQAADSARTASQAAAVAPQLLGGSGRRTYLVAFVTPAEARASGGFMGNYGILVADHGRLDLTRVGRDDELDRAGDPATKAITGPPDYVARYGRFDPAHTWANVTMSPDFPSVAQAMAELFPQSGGPQVDGVIRVDPLALSGLLALTGPVHVDGLPFALDAENVAPFLLAGQYQQFDDQSVRTELLGDVAEAAFDQFTSGVGPRPAELASAIGPTVAGGNLALWFRDPAEQGFVERIGADAALPTPADGDVFGVTTQNAGGNKIESFLQRTVSYDVHVDTATGEARTTVRVSLHNDAPAGGFPDYVIGNLVGLPVGTNRSYVSLYSSQQLRSAERDGKPLALRREREGGLAVASTFLDIAPGATTSIELELAGPIDLSSGRYRFAYVPQVMVRPDRVRWSLATDSGGRVTGTDTVGNAEVVRTARSVAVRPRPAPGRWSIEVAVDRGRPG
ncbi:hypothetical protein BH10ACT1_BH10ACT1_35580 [soil metagenome]